MRLRHSRLNIYLRLLLAIGGLLIASQAKVSNPKYQDNNFDLSGSIAAQSEIFSEKLKTTS